MPDGKDKTSYKMVKGSGYEQKLLEQMQGAVKDYKIDIKAQESDDDFFKVVVKNIMEGDSSYLPYVMSEEFKSNENLDYLSKLFDITTKDFIRETGWSMISDVRENHEDLLFPRSYVHVPIIDDEDKDKGYIDMPVSDDNRYFDWRGSDKIPVSMMEDMIRGSLKAGIDPMDVITTGAMETRFDTTYMQEPTNNLNRVFNMHEDLARGEEPWYFDVYVNQRGYANEFTTRNFKGYHFDTDRYVTETPLARQKQIAAWWGEYLTEKGSGKWDKDPYYFMADVLKKVGIQGYNPKELKGNKDFMGNEYKEDRIDKYKRVRSYLEESPEFMRQYDSIYNTVLRSMDDNSLIINNK
jgi:hypothetical protein